MKYRLAIQIIFPVFFLIQTSSLLSQTCDSKYILNNYKGTTFLSFSKAAFTPTNEIITAGTMPDYNEAGYLAKFSKNGIPLWSNYYIINFYDFVLDIYFSKIRFLDFVLTEDGGVIVAGQTERYQFKQYALLAKINKHGTVEWTKTYYPSGGFGNLSFNNVYKTADGDIIAYMSNDAGPSVFFPVYSYNRVICYSSAGVFKWGTSLLSGTFDGGGNGVGFKRDITQLANKNIVVGDVVCKSDKTSPVFKINDGRLHFYSLNYKTGKIEWESDYKYSLPPNDSTFIPTIESVTELSDGRLAFSTSLYLSTPAEPALKKKPATIITDNKGGIQKLITFYSLGNSCDLVDVVSGNNPSQKNLLFRVNGLPVISSVTNEETVRQSKGYTSIYPANCFAAGARGYGILLSNNNAKQFKLLLTDTSGGADCVQTTADILTEVVIPAPGNANPVITDEQIYTPADYKNYFIDYGYPLVKKGEYPLAQTKECEEQIECCKDFVDSVNIKDVKLCEGSSYTLPDNSSVKDPGVYPVTYKTHDGCDSIRYYRIQIDKNIAALSLGNDTCLLDQNPIQLKVKAGYGIYNWMGLVSMDTTYTVKKTGLYWVRVTNICGTKTDSVEVFDRCDFPVYIPDAFTPNGDNLNDSFGLPKQNKNRLVSLKIFDRWGRVVFETNSADKRWNGKYKGQVLSTAVFVYYLTMKGLSGNKITQKGKIILIR